MPEKKRSVRKTAAAAPAAGPATAPLTDEPDPRTEAESTGLPRESISGEGTPAGPGGTAAKPAGTKSAAVRMLTRSVAGKKPAAVKG